MHIPKLLLEFRLSVNRTLDMSAFFKSWSHVSLEVGSKLNYISQTARGHCKVRQAFQMRGPSVDCGGLMIMLITIFFFHVFACCNIFIIERWGKGEEQRQTTELQSGISISWAAIVTFLWLGDGYRTLQYSILALSLEGVFFILFPLPCSRGAIEELQVATQRSEHLYLQVGDGFGWRCQGGRGHGAIEQRVGWVAARRVCSLPVGLQVFSQVFTSILQLILI